MKILIRAWERVSGSISTVVVYGSLSPFCSFLLRVQFSFPLVGRRAHPVMEAFFYPLYQPDESMSTVLKNGQAADRDNANEALKIGYMVAHCTDEDICTTLLLQQREERDQTFYHLSHLLIRFRTLFQGLRYAANSPEYSHLFPASFIEELDQLLSVAQQSVEDGVYLNPKGFNVARAHAIAPHIENYIVRKTE